MFPRPDRIEVGTVMHLDQIKLKIPPALFSWDLYSGSQEGEILLFICFDHFEFGLVALVILGVLLHSLKLFSLEIEGLIQISLFV